jgi:FkbM family methyltransferase
MKPQRRERARAFLVFGAKVFLVVLVCTIVVVDHFPFPGSNATYVTSLSSQSKYSQTSVLPTAVDYDVGEACKALPFIRPGGTYFLNAEIKKAPSPEAVDPPFHIGSFLGGKATRHMKDDIDHFILIKELLEGRENGGLTLDIGANQGFYTYYLAALGMEVHAFEISKSNFVALQHGAEFNPREISERAFIYPVGLGKTTGRMSIVGAKYEGHLKQGGGNILATSFDCFAYHNIHHLGNDLISNVAFVKIDVEGFEIAVLAGAKQSLFGPHGKVGGLLIEVGPSRWNRANVNFETGVNEMKELSTHFQDSYIIVRTSGTYVKTCPTNLAKEILSDGNPRTLNSNVLYKVKNDEWEPLLKKLQSIGGDCNFWYTNK